MESRRVKTNPPSLGKVCLYVGPEENHAAIYRRYVAVRTLSHKSTDMLHYTQA